MFWTIMRKELLQHLISFKFAVGTIVCVVLTAVFVPALLKDYAMRMEQYSAGVAYNQTELQKVMAYSNITPTVFRRPSPLSVFAEGLDKQLRHDVPIRFNRIPTLQTGLIEDNPFLAVFPNMDVSLLFKIVISILALLVAHDAICGEREDGTLLMMFSTGIPRYRVLLAKTAAGLSTVAIPVTLAFLIVGFGLEGSSSIQLTGGDWMRIGLIYGVSLLFIFVMFAVGLLASCLARKSAVSLILGLFCWVAFVVIVPNGAASLAAYINTVPPPEQREARIEAIRRGNRETKPRAWKPVVPSPGPTIVSGGLDAFGNSFAKIVSKAYIAVRINRRAIPMLQDLRAADEVHQVENDYIQELLAQRQLALVLSRLSPACLYGNVLYSLAGTDLGSHRSFLDRVRIYREQIVDYIRSHTNNFTAPCLITACTEQDMIEIGDRYQEVQDLLKTAKDPQQEKQINDNLWHTYVKKKSAQQSPLDLRDLPQFVSRSSIAASLKWVAWELTLMILAGLVVWTISLILFQRYDIRTD